MTEIPSEMIDRFISGKCEDVLKRYPSESIELQRCCREMLTK